MLRLFAVVVIISALTVFLKHFSEEFVFPVKLLAACTLIVYIINESIGYFSSFSSYISDFSNESRMISGLIKAALIAFLTKLSCDVCVETGNHLIQDIVEFAGRIMIFIICLPYITDILSVILSFID